MSISRTNYLGTVPVIGRLVGAAGVVTNGAKLLWDKFIQRDGGTALKITGIFTDCIAQHYGLDELSMIDLEEEKQHEKRVKSEAYYRFVEDSKKNIKNEILAEDVQKIKDSAKCALPFYGLKYSFDRLGEKKSGVPFMSGKPGKLDKVCAFPVFQQIIGVPRLAYHTLVLVVSGALAAGTYAVDALIERAKSASTKSKDDSEGSESVEDQKPETWQARVSKWHESNKAVFEKHKPKATRDLYRSIPVVGTFFSLAYRKAHATSFYE